MTPEQARQIIEQALDQGFKKGAYGLQDSMFISQALTVIFPQAVVPAPKEL